MSLLITSPSPGSAAESRCQAVRGAVSPAPLLAGSPMRPEVFRPWPQDQRPYRRCRRTVILIR
jgi:hypothetical protein